MKIKSVVIGKLKIPLIKPFITALRRVENVDDIVIQVRTHCGRTGWGSAAPTPVITGDTQESIAGAIRNVIAPKLIGKDISDFNNILNIVQASCINNPSAKACVDIALHDLFAQKCGLPLYQLLGGCKREIETVNTISVKDPAEMAEDGKDILARGYKTLKVKVGLNAEDDVARLKAIRAAVGNDVHVCIDANQGWTVKDALKVIREIEAGKLNIALVEQPVKAWDLEGMKYIRENTDSFIMADESCFSPRDAFRILSEKIADGLNIKLMKCGGIYNACAIYAMASTFNTPCMAGCMLESPIGLTAMGSFVSGRNGIEHADLDPITMIRENPIKGGIQLKGAKLVLPDSPGLGIEHVEGFEQMGECVGE